jgi:type I restriction enzyme M protein
MEKYSRIATRDEVVKNDFNIFLTRYIHTGQADEYRPLAETLEELSAFEGEDKETDKVLNAILKRIGI